MTAVLNNNAVSKLASSLSSGATSLSVTSGEGTKFPSPTGGDWFPVTLLKSTGALEIVKCTARSGDVLTITRAQESTSAQAFAVGDRVELRLTAAVLVEQNASITTANTTAASAVTTANQAQTDVTAIKARTGDAGSASLRNKLINAQGTINQRVYVTATATSGANQYTLDRWRVVTSGQALSFAASGEAVQMTAPAGGLEQVIEGSNIEGGVYTLSWTGTATATVNGSAITNGAQTASLTAGSNVTIRFSGGTVLKPQFERGTVATPFENRFTALEQTLCCRYYQRGSAVIGGYSQTGLGNYGTVVFGVEMRAVPTLIYGNGGQSNCSTYDVRSATTRSLLAFATVAANGGFSWNPLWQADAEL
jgi:hypothetical protein